MACLQDVSPGNFIKGYLVEDPYTLNDLQTQGIPEPCTPPVPFGNFISIQTEWNDSSASDGEFTLTLYAPSAADSDFIWVLPSGTLVEGKTLTIAADSGELNGFLTTINLTSDSFSDVEGLDPTTWVDKKLRNTLDLSQMEFADTGFNSVNVNATGNNTSRLSSLIAPKGDVNAIVCDNNEIANLDLSNVTNWTGTSRVIANDNSGVGIEVTYNANIGQLLTLNVANNFNTAAQSNKILSELNALVVGGTVRSVIMDGATNAALTHNPTDGIAAYMVLTQDKDYIIQANLLEFNFSVNSNASGPVNTVGLPLISTGTYDFLVDWGDGSPQVRITAWDQVDKVYNYGVGGAFSITIIGVLDGWNYAEDPIYRFKIFSISSWGNMRPDDTIGTFQDCDQLGTHGSTTSVLDTSLMTKMESFYSECTSLGRVIGIDNWNTSQITSYRRTFFGCTTFDDGEQDLEGLDVSSATDITEMLADTNFDGDLSGWDIENLESASNFLNGVTLSVANYDALLLSWAAQNVKFDVSFNAGSSVNTDPGAAQDAKNVLQNAPNNWCIIDGLQNPAGYTGDSYDFSAEIKSDSQNIAMWINENENILIVAGEGVTENQNILAKYNVSVPGDISSASFVTGQKFNIETQIPGQVKSVILRQDGLKMIVLNGSGDLFSYSLSTAFDLTTVTYDGVTVNIDDIALGAVQGMFIDSAGENLVYCSSGGIGGILIVTRTFSTPWDISTVSASTSNAGSAQNNAGVTANPNGTKVYRTDSDNDEIEVWILAEAWNMSNNSQTVVVDYSSETTSGRGLFVIGINIYLISGTDQTIYQYIACP